MDAKLSRNDTPLTYFCTKCKALLLISLLETHDWGVCIYLAPCKKCKQGAYDSGYTDGYDKAVEIEGNIRDGVRPGELNVILAPKRTTGD